MRVIAPPVRRYMPPTAVILICLAVSSLLTTATILFDLEVAGFSSRLRICQAERPADAVANFLIQQGNHDENLVPRHSDYQKLLKAVCLSISSHLEYEFISCTEDDEPNDFLDMRQKYITAVLGDGNELRIILREGYSSNHIARCVCSKISCTFSDFEALEDYMKEFALLNLKIDGMQELRRLKSCGFNPMGILDLGANIGQWTSVTGLVFPDAFFFMVEGNEQHTHTLEALSIPFEIALVGESSRNVTFYRQAGNGSTAETGNSVFKENSAFYHDAVETVVPMVTLDEIVTRHEFGPFQLLKLDLQGAELLALRGSITVLRDVEVIYTEVHISNYNQGSPPFVELHNFLDQQGFALYDLGKPVRTPTEHLLGLDMLFVKKSSHLWDKKCTGFPNPY